MRGTYVAARRHTTSAGNGLCYSSDYVGLDDLNDPTEVRVYLSARPRSTRSTEDSRCPYLGVVAPLA